MVEFDPSFLIIVGTLLLIAVFVIYIIRYKYMSDHECDRMNGLYPSVAGYVRSINASDPDCSGNLRDYYIKTAYNACSSDSHYVDVCNLKAIIKQGVRCLDFEVYSIQDQPVVAASNSDDTFRKETYNSVPFDAVMSTVINYAFSGGTCPNPTDPILLHLRCKSSNRTMYTNLAAILKSYASHLLGAEFSYQSNALLTAPVLSLGGKIAIIVDRTNLMEDSPLMEFVNMISGSTYMRRLRFATLSQDSDELARFNRKGMTIVLPDNDTSNSDGKICRDYGCQCVAMQYSVTDDALAEDLAFFDRKGYAFALKPSSLRFIPPNPSPPKDVPIAKPTIIQPNPAIAAKPITAQPQPNPKVQPQPKPKVQPQPKPKVQVQPHPKVNTTKPY